MQYQREAVLFPGTLQISHQRLIYYQFLLSQRLLDDWQQYKGEKDKVTIL